MPNISDRLVLAGFMLVAAQSVVAHANAELNAANAPQAETALSHAQSASAGYALSVLEGDILSGPRLTQRGIGVTAGVSVWEDGIVPYYIDPALQPFVADVVNTAIKTWNNVAGISLIAINPDEADSPADYLFFTPANGCASWIGRQGGQQAVWTAPNCSSGSMMHEIGHALGLEHEHTRPDRDQYISIDWANIDADKVRNFDISDTNKQYYGSYDYASIMHYGEFFFSANGGQTIRSLGDEAVVIGQRIAPSAGDINAITMLYASDLSLVSNVATVAGQSEVSLLVTSEYEQGANHIDVELDIGTAQLLSTNNTDWHCASNSGTLTCSKERLSGGSQSSLVLLLDEPKSEQHLSPRLLAKTPDDNLANNFGVFSPAAAKLVLSDSASAVDADTPLQASAGSAGFWMIGLLSLLLGRRHSVANERR